jgi:type IV pilus assembly protein PilQ
MMMRSFSWLLVPAFLGAGSVVTHPDGATVTAVTLSSAGGTARLAIAVEGNVQVTESRLSNPARVVVDLTGAKVDDFAGYDGVRRGLVSDVRIFQFNDSTVRAVVEFDQMPSYDVDTGTPGQVAVVFADRSFPTWRVGADGAAVAPATAPDIGLPANTRTTFRSAAPAARQQQQFQRITLNVQDMPVADVMNIFSRYSGRSIVLGSGVSGNVTVNIQDQPWPDAFQAVLAAYQLSASEMKPGGIIRVDNPSELGKLDSLEVLSMEMVRLNYAKAAEVAKSVENVVTKSRGSVTPDTSSNTLIIRDTRTHIDQVKQMIQQLDVKPLTIAVQAQLIFVDRTDLTQLGLKYDIGTGEQFFNKIIQRIDPSTGQPYNPNQNVVNLGGNSVSAISNADALISGSALDLVFSTAIGGFSVTSFLSALQRVDLTDVEAVPTINAIDNKQSQILSGEETPVRVIDASSFGQVNQAPRANVQFKQTGIKLTVTPHVTPNRMILMDIEAERSSIQPLSAADLGFTIPKQYATSRLLVADGETVPIGGLNVTTVTKTRQGIPVLSALPFVGNLFSFTLDQENRKDLIILVTPRIVDDPIGN